MNQVNDFRLDWLAFTFKPTEYTYPDYYNWKLNSEPQNLLGAFYDVFPEIEKFYMECQQLDLCKIRPGNHYAVSIDCCQYFFISFDNESEHALNKGVNVQIPSHGLYKFFEIMGMKMDNPKEDLYNMIHLLYDRYCQLSRIDLCFDDFTKTFRPIDYENWFSKGCISHNFKCRSFFTAANGAQTLYFGKMRSDKFLRIYDKFIESDGEVDSVRYEFELHGRPCKELGQFLLQEKFDFGAYLLSWFKVLDPQRLYKDQNFAASPLLPEWETWLNLEFSEVPTPIRVPHAPRKQDLQNIMKWKKACQWAIYTATTLEGADPLVVMEALGIKPESLLDIPLKYKRVLIDHNIIQGI